MDRAEIARNVLHLLEVDRELRAASFRARNAARERLPAQIAEVEKTGGRSLKLRRARALKYSRAPGAGGTSR
jgi:hypothetical protein